MKHQIRRTIILILLALLALPGAVLANGESRLWLSVEDLSLTSGREVTVGVFIENAPLIYGVESHLSFDPAVLEVVDADEKQAGVQLIPGDFLDPKQAVILQNQADNQAGTVDYALTLVNPAPAVQGDGLLARITFRAKTDGPSTIQVKNGLFGTQTGETIAPIVEGTEVNINAGQVEIVQAAPPPTAESILTVDPPATIAEDDNEATADQSQAASTSEPAGKPDNELSRKSNAQSDDGSWLIRLSVLGLGVVVTGLAGLVFVGLVVAWFWLSRTRRG